MKIFLWGLVLVAVTEVISATQSDDGKKDGQESKINRSQLDMLLTQMKQQQDRIQRLEEVDEQQRLQAQQQELKNEELQLQLHEQQQENQDQRQEIKEQRQEIKELRQQQRDKSDKQEIKELTKIKRAQRSENGTVEEMKRLIHDEVDPLIDGLESRVSGLSSRVSGLSHCELGFYNSSKGLAEEGSSIYNEETKTIFFKQNFTRTPKVVTSVALAMGFRWPDRSSLRGVFSVPLRPTTTKFDLYYTVYGMYFQYGWGVSWMACA